MVVDNDSSAVKALERAIESLGSQAALARLLGLSQTAVWKWVTKNQPLPPEHVLTVEKATGVSKHDLRPDIYPRSTVDGSAPSDASLEAAR